MPTDSTLQQTTASGPLLPSRLAQALALLANQPSVEGAPRASMRGHELRVALESSLDDGACCGFLLDFVGQGQRLRGSARGPSAPALAWALHVLASMLKCTLHDADDAAQLRPQPEAHREEAASYLAAYEAEVRASRESHAAGDDGEDARAFLDWLAREEHIALGEEDLDELAEALPMADAPALYDLLLESDAVEDVFVSESELATLLARYRARRMCA